MTPPSSNTQRVHQFAAGLLHKLEQIEPLTGYSEQLDQAYVQLADAIDECLTGLCTLDISNSENRLLSSELWNIAGHFLSRGWLLERARSKPRGYAGDYEMLSRIYEDRCCDDRFGRLIDRYFQGQAAPQAVRNRMSLMADWIVESGSAADRSSLTTDSALRLAIVGSAFGLEIRNALLRLDKPSRLPLRVTLLDLDPAAIDFAQKQLAELLPSDRLTALTTNLFRLPERQQATEPLRGADLLFCPGLFDYLDDAAAAAMLRRLYEQLAPGGRMTVFQFAPHNPTRPYMEWFGNWYLTYRDAAQLRRLVDSAGLAAAGVTFGAEPLGVDLYVTVTRL